MAPSETATGSTTLSDTSETQLSTDITTAGTYQLLLDLTNLADGDDVTVRVKMKVRSADTAYVVFEREFVHAVGAEIIAVTPPFPVVNHIGFFLQRTTGSNAYAWAIIEYT